MTKQPNFLFIMTDQHRADWLGCYGHPVVKTPNIDALAARGTRFTDFHGATPVCMPNRASFMTGRYPSVHGLRYNGCVLPERANTFVDVLREAGYQTASIGKSHLQPTTTMPPHRAEGQAEGPIAEAWKDDTADYDKEEPANFDGAAAHDFPLPYFGFDHVDLVTGHGDKLGGHYRQWFREKHPDWQELRDPANELPHNYTCPQAYRTPIPEDSYPTAYIRDRAADYLRDNAHSDAPLFTYVSFPDPHHPFNPPGKYWDMYDPDDFEVPLAFEDHENPPLQLRALHTLYQAGKRPKMLQAAFMASERHIREAMALTAGMITMIDDAVGEIVRALEETGQLDNTIIVFNSDHGDYLGDFGMLLKGAWPNQSITRVPMIWADPAARGVDVAAGLASTIDLSATILDRAGLHPYFGIQGKSLLSCIETGENVRESLLVEYNDGLPRMGFDTPARVRTVITDDWHLTLYGGHEWGELYNRRSDPDHRHNLWDIADHQGTKLTLISTLADHLIAQMDESPRAHRLA